MNKFKLGLVGAAVMGLLTANPVAAAGATRSAAALPLLAASVGSVAYKSGAEKTWRCTEVNDEALKLNKDYVNVDTAGRVVVDLFQHLRSSVPAPPQCSLACARRCVTRPARCHPGFLRLPRRGSARRGFSGR